jgi:hypothetical protein
MHTPMIKQLVQQKRKLKKDIIVNHNFESTIMVEVVRKFHQSIGNMVKSRYFFVKTKKDEHITIIDKEDN